MIKLPLKILKNINLKLKEKNYYEQINLKFTLNIFDIKVLYRLYNKEIDPLYYKSLESQLNHLYYKYGINIIKSHRQLIYTSDECISMIHLLWFDERPYINVYQRSSEFKKQFNNDIGFICYYFYNLFNFKFSNIELNNYFLKKLNYEDIILNYHIGSLHYYD